MRSRIGKILLTVGVLFLIVPLLEVLNLYWLEGFLAMLVIGWFLTIFGAALISLRVFVWINLFLGLYFYTLVRIYDYEAVTIAYLFYMIPFHILLGLILSIVAFQKNRKDKKRKS